jgi:hypothetical protein
LPRAMALSKLSGDEQGIVFVQLCNVLNPHLAVALSSASNELRTATQALLPQLRTDHEAAAALCLKLGMRSCKELREAKSVDWRGKRRDNNDLTADDLALLGTLGSVLPALQGLILLEPATGPDGVQRLAAGLGAGALLVVTNVRLYGMHVGDAGASALAAALGRGALPRLESLCLFGAAITDAGLVALAPALRRLTALEYVDLSYNPLGDEGLAALLAPPPPPAGAPPPPAGAPPPTTGVLTKLKTLRLSHTQVTDTGCATLAAAIGSGKLPALEKLSLEGIPASATAIAAVHEARNQERLKAEAAAVKAKELRDTQGANKRKAAVVKFVLCCASPLVWFVSCFRYMYQCSAI